MDTSVTDAAAFGEASASVITVGAGRGFVNGPWWCHRLVLTAAHCLPFLPPAHPFMSLEEKTYQKLLGPPGEEPSVWGECLFVNPMDDIAILGSPNNQDLAEQADAYETLVESKAAIPIAEPSENMAWLLSLNGEWFKCSITLSDDTTGLWISNAAQEIAAGMSGSPVVSSDGAAIGILSIGGGIGTGKESGKDLFEGWAARLLADLPGWFLQTRFAA